MGTDLNKNAEQAIEEGKFRTIFDNAADGILIADLESKKFYDGNNAICRMLGYSAEEIKNLGIMDIHPEKDIPYVIDQFERQTKGEFSLARDLPIRRRDGSVFYADVNSAIIKIAGKTYMLGFFHDTTERIKAEEVLRTSNEELKKSGTALRESEEMRKIFYKSSQNALMILEPPNWLFTSGNPSTIKMFRARNEKEFTSKKPYDLSPEYQPDGKLSETKALEMINFAMKNDSNFFEWTHKRLDGEEFPATVLLTRVQVDGKWVLQATVNDITERKKAEEDLKNKAEELEKMNKIMMGRELKVIELKKEIKELKEKLYV